MSYKIAQFPNENQEIIGSIQLNHNTQNQKANILTKKRGISANLLKIKPIKNVQKKNNDALLLNLITQVPKKPTTKILINTKNLNQKTNENQSNIKINNNYNNNIKNNKNILKTKSHSYSPNRILNSQMKINNGLLPPNLSSKKTLVLDLDETLVHSNFLPFPRPPDVIIKLELDNEIHDIHVLVRPGVKEFLEKMSKKYEIVIFTASLSKYADPLLDIIDKKGYCPFRLFREHCTLINSSFVKDLKKLGRNLKDIIIVDNSPISYALNPDNGLPILSWFDDMKDRELFNFIPILEFLSEVYDVRDYIRKFVVNGEINFEKTFKDIEGIKKKEKEKEKEKEKNKEVQNENNNLDNNNVCTNKVTNVIYCDKEKNENNLIRNEGVKYFIKNDNRITFKNNNNYKRKESPILKNLNTQPNNNTLKFHYRKNSYQLSQTTTNRKNNFLNTGFIQNINSVRLNNNINQNTKVNIVGIDFLKISKKKNQLKYTDIQINNENNKINNFLHSTSVQELNKKFRKGNKHFINIEFQPKKFHTKSLSYNFDKPIPSIRPNTTKRINNNKEKKGNLIFEMNEIYNKGLSKSSRTNDSKGKYNLFNPLSVSNGFNYSNKLLNDKISGKL